MTEIEQLRADIATLEAAEKIAEQTWGMRHVAGAIMAIIHDKRTELAKLEAEAAAKADPHAFAKAVLATNEDSLMIRYARHLEQRVAELEKQLASEKQQVDNVDSVVYVLSNDVKKAQTRIAELEAELSRRPVVWCNRLPDGECLRDVSGHVKVYTDKEKNDCFLVRGRFEPYTGEQS